MISQLSPKGQKPKYSSPDLRAETPSNGGQDHAFPPTVLLLSEDQTLAELVNRVVQPPWSVAHIRRPYSWKEALAWPKVRLIVLDDEHLDDSTRGWLLHQIGRRIPGAFVLYVAGNHADSVEIRARVSGAQYYVSKPLSPERFENVLSSFLKINH